MYNKKNRKIDDARRRKTGCLKTRFFKKRSFKGNRYTNNNDLTIIYLLILQNITYLQQSNLEKAL